MPFTLDDVLAATVVITALRVFAPDARRLTRRLLRAGVRVGANELLRSGHPADAAPSLTAASSDEGAQR
ncbi:hypothetical protein ACFVXC_31650 [Streptomyces sp. NPDC058257]|uniref:hypothetical protein n=1 Tax=Streptomyces sp. NPDC058257 TaxID=3346409 RepID=UPI0036EC2DCF